MTMEIDALHAGQPMRNSLDPCNACSEWKVLRCQVDSLRDALVKVLETRKAEEQAWFAAHNARENSPDRGVNEERLHLEAITAKSNAEKEARLLLATLKS